MLDSRPTDSGTQAGVERLRVGVDSGGTFTDVTLYSETTGEFFIWKVSSTRDDPSRAISEGVQQAITAWRDDAPTEVVYFGHGTTVATNALIEKRGAQTGLITTRGFRDVLEIARQVRPGLYDLAHRRPTPLSTRDLRFEVTERMTYEGAVQAPLDEAEVREAARALKAAGIGAVAVCLINSYRNPAHEARIRQIMAEEYPEVFLTVSTEIAPEYREFERTSTSVVNSYVGPIIRDYLQNLVGKLEDQGIVTSPNLTQSTGGVISFAQAQREPVRTILSGPAAGVIGATQIASAAGFDNIITFDMGGTSTDVALIEGASPRMAAEVEVHGYPLSIPMLDIETVGAGGGSIARVDAGGLLEVGPASAGANPGPACYEKGNTEPTVTDANVLLQALNPVSLLNGRMPISQEASRNAIAGLADRMGVDVMDAATGILQMAIANMVKAVRVISVERGHDPRDFVLMAFGGAGPLHATRLARELGIGRVLLPKTPGVLCSLGLLLSDLQTSFAASRPMELEASALDDVRAVFEDLSAKSADWFDVEGIADEDRATTCSVDVRYAGQGHQLNVPCDPALDAEAFVASVRTAFEALHEQMYGYIVDGEAMHVTTFRMEASAHVPKVPLAEHAPATTPLEHAVQDHRDVWLTEVGGMVRCPVYDRDRMGPGHVVEGPAIIEQFDSTALVLTGQTATVDRFLNIIIEG